METDNQGKKSKSAFLQQLRTALLSDERRPAGVAEAVGIHRTNIIPFMAGNRSITLENAEKLAHAMGFDVRLVRREGNGDPEPVDILSPTQRDLLRKSLTTVLAVLDAKEQREKLSKK